jgi:hypothetical protein
MPRGAGQQVTTFDGELIREIVADLEDGIPLPIAANKAGVSLDAIRAWARRDPEVARALMRADGNRAANLWKEFDHVGPGSKDWRATAWQLERTVVHLREVKETRQQVTLEMQKFLDAVQPLMPPESYGHLVAAVSELAGVGGTEAPQPQLEADNE